MGHSEQLRQRWWSTTYEGLFPGGWLITITANHSNYLVCDRANTRSVTVGKVVKLQLNYCNALVIKLELQYRPVRRERTRDVHSSSLLIDVYALFSDVSLRRQASMTRLKFPDPFCSRAMLFCSIIWLEADVAGCCSAGSVLRWHEVAPYSVSLICIV